MATVAEHDQFRSALRASGKVPDDESATALAYVMRCVVHVEVFVFGRALNLSDMHASEIASPLFENLYKAHRKQIDNSWKNALAAIRLHAGTDPSRYAERKAIDGYILARNCWAHGAGDLTDRQVRDMSVTVSQLSDAGFSVQDRRVVVEPAQVRGVARICRDYVRKLDQATCEHMAAGT